MFTVLHRNADNSETLYTAAVVSRDAISPPPAPLEPADIILRGVPKGMEHGPGARRVTDDMIVLSAGTRSTKDATTPMVFVMNSAGATVARYYL